MNEDTTTVTPPACTVLAEASYDARHLLFVRYYAVDDGLLVGCGAADSPVLAKAPAENLRAIIQTMNQGLEGHFEVPMDKGFSVSFKTLQNGCILILALHPDQGRIAVMLDAALTMMALGDSSEGDSMGG